MRFEVTHPDRVLFPDAGITKGDLVSYYERVADWMLPHVRDRPVSMQRFPEGIDGYGFFHKDVPDHFPDWVARIEVPKHGGSVTHALIRNADSLAYLANQGTITPHVWLSRADRLTQPDRMVFDLDPPGDDFATVRRSARALGELLEQIGLAPFAQVTGSRGVHVWVPLRRRADFEQVATAAREIAEVLVERHPDELTLAKRKAKRGDRIYVDIDRTRYAQTVVPPYAVRPRPGAPVATPLEWDELSSSRLRPDGWTVETIGRRLAKKGDPWREIGKHARGLSEARTRLRRLR